MWVINILLSEVAGNSNVSVFVRLLKKMSTYFRSLLEVLNIVLNIGTILREKEKRNSSIEVLDFFLGHIHTAQQVLWWFTIFSLLIWGLTLRGSNRDKILSSSICFSSEFLITALANYKNLKMYRKITINFCFHPIFQKATFPQNYWYIGSSS